MVIQLFMEEHPYLKKLLIMILRLKNHLITVILIKVNLFFILQNSFQTFGKYKNYRSFLNYVFKKIRIRCNK